MTTLMQRSCLLGVALLGTLAAVARAEWDYRLTPSGRIQTLLQVPFEGREALKLMEEFVSRRLQGASAESLDPLVLRFADAVLRGVEPGCLGHVDRIDVRNSSWFVHAPNVDPKTGSMEASLKRQLIKLAADRAIDRPEEARRLARAYLILRAQQRAEFSAGAFPQKIGETSFYDVAGLTERQRAELDAIMGRLRDQRMACVPHYKLTCDILMELIENPGGEGWERIPDFVSQLSQGWRKCPDELGIRFALATHSWRLLCLARHHCVATVEPALRAVADELKEQTADPVARRWLDEIFTIPGGPPTHPGVRVVTHPNERKPGRP